MKTDTPLDANRRYEQFLLEVKRTDTVWALKKDHGWACRELDDRSVIPVWSRENDARECADASFPGSTPVSLSLIDFRDVWLPDLQEKEYWVGVNLLADLGGIDVRPDELARECADV